MIEFYLAGGGLRLFQTIVYSSLWIVAGCFIAAVFRRMLDPQKLRRIFADDTRWGLLIGWLIGMLLPVCSLGVIPIVRELHRAGVKRGTIVAFGLTAPLFNPMSVLYGLTLSDPIAILSFSLCALVIVSGLGAFWGRWVPSDPQEYPNDKLPTPGIKRTGALMYSTAKEIVGPTGAYIAIGILASTLLATLLPKGYLQNQVEVENTFAPIVVALVGTPVYSSPLLAMSQIGGMFSHGNSIGAAFSLLILGAGTNLGLFFWLGKTYGVFRVFVFYLMLLTTTVGLAYLVDKPLYPKGIDPAGHTHAFDVYTHPYSVGQDGLTANAMTQATDFWESSEVGGTSMLLLLIGCGGLLLLADRVYNFEEWFFSPDETKKKFDTDVPGWILGVTVVSGLVIASVVGCYLYYPAHDEVLQDLFAVNTEAVLSARNKQWEAAQKWIGFSDDLSRRLEVGTYLRNGSVSEFQSTKARIYREELDKLRMAVDNRATDQVQKIGMDVSNAFRRMSKAFRTTSKP